MCVARSAVKILDKDYHIIYCIHFETNEQIKLHSPFGQGQTVVHTISIINRVS